jgi:hypothetical protein
MPAHAKGYVSLAVGGKSIKLRYDFNALADAEEILGKPVHQVFQDGQTGLREIRTLLFVGSQGVFRTPREAGAVLTSPEILQEVSEAIGEALSAAFGMKQEDAAGEAEAPIEGPG